MKHSREKLDSRLDRWCSKSLCSDSTGVRESGTWIRSLLGCPPYDLNKSPQVIARIPG